VLRDRSAAASSRSLSEGDVSDFDAELGDPPPFALDQLTRAWQERAVSNADYLAQLNSMAGRTASDFTQYPVFPWVIADYKSSTLDLTSAATFRDLSKPMGALNSTRLQAARDRYREMPRGAEDDPPFLWGAHYSTPGYILHFLVRALPEHMLHLQSGRFDAADRLFFDVSSTWEGVTSTNAADVKELIPEFYFSEGSFLQLPDGNLDLGVRANGRRVGDVILPPWAFGPADFVARCREALESEWVSSQLHNWVDLIFGYKQRGAAAVQADNLFYFLTYDNAVDIESISDPDRVLSLQSQIAVRFYVSVFCTHYALILL
jgi:factor associated with neutral sphingomyelinase activation